MSTAIVTIVEQLPDIYIADCVQEILNWHETAILGSGKLRNLAEEIDQLIHAPENKLRLAEDLILKEAAKRFMIHIYYDPMPGGEV